MLEVIRVLVLLAFATLYAYFDIFNKRSIPDSFVYLSIIVGIIFTFFYPLKTLELSLLIAAFVVAASYILYKAGFLGLGDGLELAFVSLMLPIQPTPLVNIPQLGLPFILSVFISSGIVAIIALPIYYMLNGKPEIRKESVMKAFVVFISYLLLLMLVYLLLGHIALIPIVFIIIIAFFSALIFLFEVSMNERMITWIYPSRLGEDDIIAINLMSKKDIMFFKSRYPGFGRLADRKAIIALRNIKKKIPVYTNAIPFSAFILSGIILSLLIGDPILLILV
jgi:Flp pilus assembly protein protease CpaA